MKNGKVKVEKSKLVIDKIILKNDDNKDEKRIDGFGMFKGLNLPSFKRDRFDDHKEF